MAGAEENLPTFSFLGSAPAGSPLSYQALQTRRKIAEQLLGRGSPFPKGIGEGLTYLGEKIAQRRMMEQLDEAEQRQAGIESGIRSSAPPEEYAVGPGTPAAPLAAQPVATPIPEPDVRTAASLPEAEGSGGFNFMDAAAGPDAAPVSGFNRAAYEQTFAGTPLAGKADKVIELARQNNIPPALMASIMAHETGQGTSLMLRKRNNPAGIMDPQTNWMTGRTYGGLDEGLENAANIIGKNYRRGGGTVEGMSRTYAPPKAPNDPGNLNRFWTGGVSKYNQRFSDTGAPGAVDAGPATGRNAIAQEQASEAPAETAMGQAPAIDERDAISAALTPPPTAAGIPGFTPPGAPDAMPTMLGTAPPTATDIKPAPDLLPSQQAIPQPRPQEMEPPGAPPKPPDRLGPSKAMVHWSQYINNPNVSETLRKHAEEQYKRGDELRKELQTQQQEAYRHERNKWEVKSDAYDKFKREAYDRDIEQRVKITGIENTIVDITKKRMEMGEPFELATQKARLEVAQAQRNLAKPDTVSAAGTQFERPYAPPGQPQAEYAVPAGLPKAEVKAPTKEQADAIKFALRVKDDLNEADSKMGYGKALTDLTQHNLAQSAAVLGQGNVNSVLRQDYKDARDRYKNFGTAFMTSVSGAAYGVREAEENLMAYIPMPGDDDRRLRDKAVRRNRFVDAVVKAGGQITMDAAKDIGKSSTSSGSSGLREGQTGMHKGRPVVVRNGEWVLQ